MWDWIIVIGGIIYLWYLRSKKKKKKKKKNYLPLVFAEQKEKEKRSHATKRPLLFSKPFLTQIDLPSELKEAIQTTVQNDDGESTRTMAKRLMPMFEGITVVWPYDHDAFEAANPKLKEKLECIIGKVLREKYLERTLDQLIDNADGRPYWMIVPIRDNRTPTDCDKHSKVKHYTDAFWQQKPIFCQREGCRCRIRAFNERSLKRHQSK